MTILGKSSRNSRNRLFVAIPLPSEPFQSLQRKCGFRETQAHLTLHFIGEGDAQSIGQRLSSVSFSPFTIIIDRIGAFPSLSAPRVIWVGIEPNPVVQELHKEILKALGAKDKQEFIPHITLARISPGVKFPRLEIIKESFQVSSFILYNSTLASDGPVYDLVRIYTSRSSV